MAHLILGAGQIGTQLCQDLISIGEEVTAVRRSAGSAPGGSRQILADVLDRDAWREAARGATAIHCCIHARYDSKVWARDLPVRERTVMDIAAQVGAPVIFPESVYAFGTAASDLVEGASVSPLTPLGRVRADLLAARERHRATTISLVSSDLIGPTAGSGSIATTMVLRPIAAGRCAWVFANPDASHSWTFLPDLSRAMIDVAGRPDDVAPTGSAVLHTPTAEPRSLRSMADEAGLIVHGKPGRVKVIPTAALAAASRLSQVLREVRAQQHLWQGASVLRPGRLMTHDGLTPTPWPQALRDSLRAVTTT